MQTVNLNRVSRKDCIPCDRSSILGNPFEMRVKNASERELVIRAFREYLYLIVLHRHQPDQAASMIARRHSLPISSKWKRSTRSQFLSALHSLEPGDKLGCWCEPDPCHVDIIIAYHNWSRQQSA